MSRGIDASKEPWLAGKVQGSLEMLDDKASGIIAETAIKLHRALCERRRLKQLETPNE